jgi:septum formation protein
MRLILASTSDRRRDILALLGLPFEVISPNFHEEPRPNFRIDDEVLDFALGKAESVARGCPGSIVIGSDTMIHLGEQKIGKPKDPSDARTTLRALCGRTHEVLTGLAIVNTNGGAGLQLVERISVQMRSYTDEEIDRYISLGESLDKAGAYSLQGEGRFLIQSIHGDYLAAVGLPLRPIADYLQARNIRFPLDLEKLYAERSFLNWRSLS